jgi:hypothetical protein
MRKETRKRREINQQAWKDIGPAVRRLYQQRRDQLLAAQRLRRPGRRRPADGFRDFVLSLLGDGALDDDPDLLDMVEEFLTAPSAGTRLRLIRRLKNEPALLGGRAGELRRFWLK